MKKIIFTILLLVSNFAFSETENQKRIKKSEKLTIEFYRKIIAKAEKDWPDDYMMQKHEIDRQSKNLLEIINLKIEMQELEKKANKS